VTNSMIGRKTIPVAHPVLDGNEKKYVLECLESGWISSIGPFIGSFEESFARFCGATHAIACNNGTSALHLALAALGAGPGDEIIVPTLTFVATANAVRYCGAQPVFVDSQACTMNLNPDLLEQAVTERTKGIIAVHLYGHSADMDRILDVARRHDLFVIEDAAEAHGAIYKDRQVGSLAHAATFSFYGNKILSTGEGGMVTTSDASLRDRLRLLRGQGMDPDRRYWFPIVGYNYRMTNIAAAIGLAQLEQIDRFLDQRRNIACKYGQYLTEVHNHVEIPTEQPWAKHAFWSYPVILRDSVAICRDDVMKALEEDAIETRPVFHPMHTLPPYRDARGEYPIADRLATRGLCLPMHGLLNEDHICYISQRLAHWCTYSGT
jgi:perosamine synthetase